MGTRETQRREWREAVARAAEEMQRGRHKHRTVSSVLYADYIRHREALSAPKPWTRPAKADLGKRNYSAMIALLREAGDVRSAWDVLIYFPGSISFRQAREIWEWREALRRKRRAAQRRRRYAVSR